MCCSLKIRQLHEDSMILEFDRSQPARDALHRHDPRADQMKTV